MVKSVKLKGGGKGQNYGDPEFWCYSICYFIQVKKFYIIAFNCQKKSSKIYFSMFGEFLGTKTVFNQNCNLKFIIFFQLCSL